MFTKQEIKTWDNLSAERLEDYMTALERERDADRENDVEDNEYDY
jgi:hypothetical protein